MRIVMDINYQSKSYNETSCFSSFFFRFFPLIPLFENYYKLFPLPCVFFVNYDERITKYAIFYVNDRNLWWNIPQF